MSHDNLPVGLWQPLRWFFGEIRPPGRYVSEVLPWQTRLTPSGAARSCRVSGRETRCRSAPSVAWHTAWAIGSGSIGKVCRADPTSFSCVSNWPCSFMAASGTGTQAAPIVRPRRRAPTSGSGSSRATCRGTAATVKTWPVSAGSHSSFGNAKRRIRPAFAPFLRRHWHQAASERDERDTPT